MRLHKIFLLILLFVNLVGIFLSIFLSSKVIKAQSVPLTQNAARNAIPTPYVPCNQVRPTGGQPQDRNYFSNPPLAEFHSLRPYQASPCVETTPASQMAMFCGNDIYIRDTAMISMNGRSFNLSPPSPAQNINPENCEINEPAGTQTCTFLVSRNRSISVDLSNLNLPALGNTQNVRNITNSKMITRITSKEQIDDAQKLNNYITWYLSGTLYKPEYTYPYPNPLSLVTGFLDENVDDFRRIIDYSGPLNKLLPQRIQYEARERQIDQAIGNITQNRSSFEDATPRHNQVVICTIGFSLSGWNLFGNTNGQIGNFPIPCNTDAGFWANFVSLLITRTRVSERGYRIGYWQNQVRRPPKEENFTSFTDYTLAVNRWRGQICQGIRLPATGEAFDWLVPSALRGLGINFCYNDPLDLINSIDPTRNESNIIDAEFFPYIPYSSTEDRIGNFGLAVSSDPVGQEQNIQVISRELRGRTSSNMYLPHLQASEELADIIQSQFVPFDLPKNAPALKKDIFVDVDPRFFGSCQAVEAREGPLGDNVFADSFNTTFLHTSRVRCNFPLPAEGATAACVSAYRQVCPASNPNCDPSQLECVPSGSYSCSSTYGNATTCGANYTCGIGCTTSLPTSCIATTNHIIDVNVNTPLLDSIWSRLVAGPTSVFRRIMPKVGMGSFLRQIWDLPGASYVSYTSLDQGVSLTAGDSDLSGSNAQAYFPHLGGIYEYFLNCIQTGLRPKKTDGSSSVCLPPIATTGSRPPIPAPLCTSSTQPTPTQTVTPTPTQATTSIPTQTGSPTTTPTPSATSGSGIALSEQQLRNLLRSYNLISYLDEQQARSLYENNLNPANTNPQTRRSNLNASISALELLKAERDLIAMGFNNVRRYITTAWIWYETGRNYWPDPYLYNCDDGEQANNPNDREQRLSAAYDISNYCTKIKPDTIDPDFLIQVAGFQATESRKLYRTAFTRIYGGSNTRLREVLMDVVNKSSRASREMWNYNSASQQRGLVSSFLTHLTNPSSPEPVTINDIAQNGSRWPSSDIASQRQQFFTFMLGKDPKMAIYLNTPEYGGGVSDGSIVSEQNRSILANMIYALWLLETNSGANIPSDNISIARGICVEQSNTVDTSDNIKYPIVSASNNEVYLSYTNFPLPGFSLSTKTASDVDFRNGNSYNVARASDIAYINAHTYIDSNNLYYIWADHSGTDTVFLKRVSLSNVSSITTVQTFQVASGPNPDSYIALPRVLADGNLVIAAWNEGGRVRYSVSNDNGTNWSQILTASQFEVYGTMPPSLAKSGAGGEISLVYGAAGREFGNVYILRFDRSSNTFVNEVLVAEGKGGQYDYAFPNHVYDSNRNTIIAFRDIGTGRMERVYVATKNSQDWNTEWQTEVVSDSTRVYGTPSISADEQGGVHVFWPGGNMVYYTYRSGFGVWGPVYSAQANSFVANADNVVSRIGGENLMHGVVEEHFQGTVKTRYFLFRNR